MNEALFAAALQILSHGRKDIDIIHDPALADRRNEVATLLEIDEEVGREGALISPEVDPVILASLQFFESTWRTHPPDGDPCRCSLGPMQIGSDTRWWFPVHRPEWAWLHDPPTMPERTVRMRMREPITNVRLGYAMLKFWKGECGGQPGSWISADGWGKCTPKKFQSEERYVDWEGKRRCALATKLLDATGRRPPGWHCIHGPAAAAAPPPALASSDGAAEEQAQDEVAQ